MPKYWGKQIFSVGSGSKAKDGEKKEEKKKERLKVGNSNGQLRIANATSGGARKAAGANRQTDKVNGRVGPPN